MPSVKIVAPRTPVDPKVTPERPNTRNIIHYTPQRLSLTLPTGRPDRRINGGEGVVGLFLTAHSAVKTGDGIRAEARAIELIDSPHVVKGKLFDDELLMPLAHGDLLSIVLQGLSIHPNDRPHLSHLQGYISNSIEAIHADNPDIISELKTL